MKKIGTKKIIIRSRILFVYQYLGYINNIE